MKALNPFSIYFFSWLTVIILYFLDWSSLYPPLKWPLISFFCITGLIAFFLSVKARHTNNFNIIKLSSPERFKKMFIRYIIACYILLFIEFIVNGGIPIIIYSLGMQSADRDYMDFGIPVIRVLVINSFGVISSFSAYSFVSSNGKDRNIWVYLMILSLIPPIICVQRGIALNQMAGIAITFLLFYRLKIVIFIKLFVLSMGIIYLFGVIGNMRSANNDNSLYYYTWEINENFKKTGLPDPYFWGYVYSTSPLANLQNAIDKKNNINDYKIGDFVVLDILPQIISKKLDVQNDNHRYFVHPTLVVCTTFINSYVKLGWVGMYVMFFYIMFFVWFLATNIRLNSPFRIPLLVCLCNIVFWGIFDNMVHYMGFIPQIVCFYVLSWYSKKNIILKSV